ncbi:hypothetical protein [Roseibium algae]|uniref:Uncharacterized protein n=1 Tax=Roseibium algae TaxID=3123038 RepID=A0ABU8TKE3_9HYPH
MCMVGGAKAQSVETPPAPRKADPERQASALQDDERRRRASAYGRGATTLTSPLGVSNYGSQSRSGVTLLGRA